MLKTVFPYNMQLFATVTNIVEHPWVFSPKNRQKIRQNPAKKTTMTFVLAIVKSILATQRNDFGFNKCELKSLNNVGYCGKKWVFFKPLIRTPFFQFLTLPTGVSKCYRYLESI